MPQLSVLLQRFVPFVAVASANCVNIPLMRQSEILGGSFYKLKKKPGCLILYRILIIIDVCRFRS